mgnify:CR=1 FL=1
MSLKAPDIGLMIKKDTQKLLKLQKKAQESLTRKKALKILKKYRKKITKMSEVV